MHSTLQRIEEPRFDDDPHDAPIAPDVIPTAWVDRGPPRPANDATSRERLFAEIQSATEAIAPDVDHTFRATEVNDSPVRKDTSSKRTWMKRASMAFAFALVSAIAAAAWQHHGDVATQTVANWVPSANSSSAPESTAATEQANAAPAQPADQLAAAAPAQTAAATTDAEQQIQSMARDLATMSQQIAELKASIEQLKASQQAATVPAPAARAPAPKPPPRAAMLPPRPAPSPPPAPRYAAPSAQAAAIPPPPAAAVPPPAYQPPPQAVVQPNGEPVVRPPAPLPLLPDRQ